MTYHKVDRAPSPENICTGDNGLPAIQMLRGARVIERCSFRIKLHVNWVNARTIDPNVM